MKTLHPIHLTPFSVWQFSLSSTPLTHRKFGSCGTFHQSCCFSLFTHSPGGYRSCLGSSSWHDCRDEWDETTCCVANLKVCYRRDELLQKCVVWEATMFLLLLLICRWILFSIQRAGSSLSPSLSRSETFGRKTTVLSLLQISVSVGESQNESHCPRVYYNSMSEAFTCSALGSVWLLFTLLQRKIPVNSSIVNCATQALICTFPH